MTISSQAGLASFAALAAVPPPIIEPLIPAPNLAADAITVVPLTMHLAA